MYFVSVWASQGCCFYIIYYDKLPNVDVLLKGITHRNSSVHYRLLCASSFLGIFVISNYFTASYTSMLSIPIFEPTVNSVEDLAYKESAIKTLLVKGSSTDELILVSIYLKIKSPIFKINSIRTGIIRSDFEKDC